MALLTQIEIATRRLTLAMGVCCAAAVGFAATSAEARLINPNLPAPTEHDHDAIHLPTGCLAKVILDDRGFVSGAITDPLCLPKGVLVRNVPGSLYDFEVIRLPRVH